MAAPTPSIAKPPAPQAAYKPALLPPKYCPPGTSTPSQQQPPPQRQQQQPRPEQATSPARAPAPQPSSFTDALLSMFNAPAGPAARPPTPATPPGPGPATASVAHTAAAATPSASELARMPTQRAHAWTPQSYATALGSPPTPAPVQAPLSRSSSSASGRSSGAALGAVAAVYTLEEQQQAPDLAQQGSPGSAEERRMRAGKTCRICEEQSADYIVLPCRHWVRAARSSSSPLECSPHPLIARGLQSLLSMLM